MAAERVQLDDRGGDVESVVVVTAENPGGRPQDSSAVSCGRRVVPMNRHTPRSIMIMQAVLAGLAALPACAFSFAPRGSSFVPAGEN